MAQPYLCQLCCYHWKQSDKWVASGEAWRRSRHSSTGPRWSPGPRTGQWRNPLTLSRPAQWWVVADGRVHAHNKQKKGAWRGKGKWKYVAPTHLAWSWPREKSTWWSTTPLSDAGITQPVNKLFTHERHMIWGKKGGRVKSIRLLITMCCFSTLIPKRNVSLSPSVRQSGLWVMTLFRMGRVCVSNWHGPSDCLLSRLRSNWAQ